MGRILVTGGSGKLGRAVLRDLVAHGNEVINLDQQALPEPICPTIRIDLSNFGEVAAADVAGVGLSEVGHFSVRRCPLPNPPPQAGEGIIGNPPPLAGGENLTPPQAGEEAI